MHSRASFTSFARAFYMVGLIPPARRRYAPPLAFVLISLIVMMLAGCGRRGLQERAAVRGKITLNGVDVFEGVIAFYPKGDTKGPAAGASIKNGHYEITERNGPIVGTNRVEIRIPKRTGRKVRPPLPGSNELIDEILEAAPDCYNAHSTLSATVKTEGNIFDFALHSN